MNLSNKVIQEIQWRRFKPLKEDLTELDKLIQEKGLTREDLKVILTSIELSEMGKAMIADEKGWLIGRVN